MKYLKPLKSSDGSLTLFNEHYNEAYHSSKDGALRESLQKHVIPALRHHQGKTHLRILDICFGLGYNTLTTLYYVQKHRLDTRVEIVSPELDKELVRSLDGFEYPKIFEPFKQIIASLATKQRYQDERFKIDIVLGDARKMVKSLPKEHFDVIYQDAFSPKVNPALWTIEWFGELNRLSHSHTILTTYSTAMTTRLALFENGFRLYEYRGEGVRKSLLASLSPLELEGAMPIDMAHKIACNPDARALRDSELKEVYRKP